MSSGKYSFGEWIYCGDEKPKTTCEVITCAYRSDGESLVSTGMYESYTDTWYDTDGYPSELQPTYWMELPMPPDIKAVRN